jgi:hypothetical protein
MSVLPVLLVAAASVASPPLALPPLLGIDSIALWLSMALFAVILFKATSQPKAA